MHGGHRPGRAAAPRAMVSRANGISQHSTRCVGSTMGRAWDVVPATVVRAADEATAIMGAPVVVDGGLSWKSGSPLLDRLSGCSPPPEPLLPMAGCSGERRPPRTGGAPIPIDEEEAMTRPAQAAQHPRPGRPPGGLHYSWVIVGILVVVQVIGGAISQSAGVMVPPLRDPHGDFGWGSALSGHSWRSTT